MSMHGKLYWDDAAKNRHDESSDAAALVALGRLWRDRIERLRTKTFAHFGSSAFIAGRNSIIGCAVSHMSGQSAHRTSPSAVGVS
jgi:hypothetical protein